ncbi:MAG: Cu2+-exporting ATPase, partial [Oceanospirillaceae bacterium]
FKPYLPAQNTLQAQDITVTLGQGIEGIYEGVIYRLGKAGYAEQLLTQPIDISIPKEAGHWLLLCNEHQVIAWFLISDTLREDSLFCINALKQKNITVHMLTGDSSSNVPEIAQHLGIENVCQSASPEDKVKYIQALQQDANKKVVMVGDGINDLPVLAGAQTSIAMGSASDLAKTHADAVLTNGELSVIIQGLALARKTKMIIKQNIGWAVCYNFMALPLAAFGLIPPYAAAIGMSLSSLIVVTNALRLAKQKPLVSYQSNNKAATHQPANTYLREST